MEKIDEIFDMAAGIAFVAAIVKVGFVTPCSV